MAKIRTVPYPGGQRYELYHILGGGGIQPFLKNYCYNSLLHE